MSSVEHNNEDTPTGDTFKTRLMQTVFWKICIRNINRSGELWRSNKTST